MKESISLYVLQIRERTELLFSHIKAPLPGGQMAITVCLFFSFLLFNIFSILYRILRKQNSIL